MTTKRFILECHSEHDIHFAEVELDVDQISYLMALRSRLKPLEDFGGYAILCKNRWPTFYNNMLIPEPNEVLDAGGVLISDPKALRRFEDEFNLDFCGIEVAETGIRWEALVRDFGRIWTNEIPWEFITEARE